MNVEMQITLAEFHLGAWIGIFFWSFAAASAAFTGLVFLFTAPEPSRKLGGLVYFGLGTAGFFLIPYLALLDGGALGVTAVIAGCSVSLLCVGFGYSNGVYSTDCQTTEMPDAVDQNHSANANGSSPNSAIADAKTLPRGITVCPSCRMRVILKANGSCPSCGRIITTKVDSI